jgi:hypothetical protein
VKDESTPEETKGEEPASMNTIEVLDDNSSSSGSSIEQIERQDTSHSGVVSIETQEE